MLEWLKRHAWKACKRQKRFPGSNPGLSAFKEFSSCPKFLFFGIVHYALAFRAGLSVPYPYVVAATIQAKPAYFTSVRWGHIGNDATNHDVLNGLAVWARHGCYLLTEQPAPLIHFGLVAAYPAAIFQFPSHTLAFLCLDPVLQPIVAFNTKNGKTTILAGLSQSKEYRP